MKNFIKLDKSFFVIVFLLIGGCYSSLPIEFSKIDDYKELSKIKLKDKSEYSFNNGENQLLSLDEKQITFIDQGGVTRKVFFSEIEKFYTYRIDGTKVLFSTMWIIFGIISLYVILFGVPTLN